MTVTQIPLSKVFKRTDGLLKFELKDLPLPPEFSNVCQVMISIPPGRIGGNHKHVRRELFVSLSDDVELHWVAADGSRRVERMKEGDNLYLFDVPSLVPHAILNRAKSKPAIILELSDNAPGEVEPVEVIPIS